MCPPTPSQFPSQLPPDDHGAQVDRAVRVPELGDRQAVGAGAARGWRRGVRDQPGAGGAVSGAALHLGSESDAGDAHVLAEIVRLDREHHRPIAGDSPDAEAVKLLARTHQSLIWGRTRQVLRLRSALWEFFPAALEAFDDLSAADTLELLDRAPDPDRAARLSRSQLAGALRRGNRRNIDAKAAPRVMDDGREASVVDRPDEWWAVPARLRTVRC